MTTEQELIKRTKLFALRTLKQASALPGSAVEKTIASHVIRSGMSVGAHYRAACRARSAEEYIAKLGIVEAKADETIYWLELIIEAGLIPARQITPLLTEANELLAITVASRKTARNRKSNINNRKSP